MTIDHNAKNTVTMTSINPVMVYSNASMAVNLRSISSMSFFAFLHPRQFIHRPQTAHPVHIVKRDSIRPVAHQLPVLPKRIMTQSVISGIRLNGVSHVLQLPPRVNRCGSAHDGSRTHTKQPAEKSNHCLCRPTSVRETRLPSASAPRIRWRLFCPRPGRDGWTCTQPCFYRHIRVCTSLGCVVRFRKINTR